MRTISFRIDDEDLEKIEQVKAELQKKTTYLKISSTDVIIAGIYEIWNKLCLPYKDENNKTTG